MDIISELVYNFKNNFKMDEIFKTLETKNFLFLKKGV